MVDGVKSTNKSNQARLNFENVTLKEGQSRSQWCGLPNPKNTVANSKEIRQFPQSQTDYQNSEAGNNGKSGISQMPKKFPSQLPKNNASKHPA